MIDHDARAVRAAQRNVADARASFRQWDLRSLRRPPGVDPLDFVVTNPPFHLAGELQVALGRDFIQAAKEWLADRGRLLLVANVTLPYEHALRAHFKESRETVRAGGYKVLEARLVKEVRLDRLLANLGYGSRTEVRDILEQGAVVLDDRVLDRSDASVNAGADLREPPHGLW